MLTLKTVILECPDVRRLLSFYQALLGWPIAFDEGEFVRIECPETGMGIAFQLEEDYEPPVWPTERGRQQMMAHLDFGVSDLAELRAMADRALSLGATAAPTQYSDEDWLTLLDPAGHPFCLVIWG
ncbi:MAG: VOC family protein [Christensenellaceae bacterium]|nr:VOC family protein [Christensenellaceae bacterium]